MSGLPLKYRVKLAYGFFSVGQTFMSPPMSRAEAQTLAARGYLEEVPLETSSGNHAEPSGTKRKFGKRGK